MTTPGTVGRCDDYLCPVGQHDGDTNPATPCVPCSEGYAPERGLTACQPWTVCGSLEYASVPGTPSSDRGCAPLTECTRDQYEAIPPTETSDRECGPRTALRRVQLVYAADYDVVVGTPSSFSAFVNAITLRVRAAQPPVTGYLNVTLEPGSIIATVEVVGNGNKDIVQAEAAAGRLDVVTSQGQSFRAYSPGLEGSGASSNLELALRAAADVCRENINGSLLTAQLAASTVYNTFSRMFADDGEEALPSRQPGKGCVLDPAIVVWLMRRSLFVEWAAH